MILDLLYLFHIKTCRADLSLFRKSADEGFPLKLTVLLPMTLWMSLIKIIFYRPKYPRLSSFIKMPFSVSQSFRTFLLNHLLIVAPLNRLSSLQLMESIFPIHMPLSA
jgi:hypothetical protein